MTYATYNPNIPFATDNPSDDQPLMEQNTNSISALIAVDHLPFNNNDGGMHQQVQLLSQASIPAVPNNMPSGLLKPGSGTLYTKPIGGPSNLFYTPDQSGNEYQLTTTNISNFASFGKFNPGWSFLPGGLFIMYGANAGLVNGSSVNFPFTFPGGVISVVATRQQGNTGSTWGITNVTNSGFQVSTSGGSAAFDWIAIGF